MNILTGALPAECKQGGVVRNIGCGNSEVGKKMIESRLASVVLSVDIAEGAVQALSSKQDSTTPPPKPPSPGIEEFLVLDATNLPLRTTSSIDWIFDKGTLDGLMYQSDAMDVLRRIWDEAKRGLAPHGVFVLVSLWKPEGRLSLIEDTLGGRVVDRCFEIEGLVGQGMRMEGGLSGVDRCYVYVCSPVSDSK
ncbi:hypothetical protein HK097_005398 [Rhizophlyctis rosea]|uniref:Methyltransferase type 11 domain-containing protein n=1 Tax=Rhizophlyctis rosea TaxID=64517 RepID=A0AAD5SFI9_9FUNG|nr:hypothetical protein HK097_005398 [Rhizophlyctis rosea]